MIDALVRLRSTVKHPAPMTPHQEMMRGIYMRDRTLLRRFSGKTPHVFHYPTEGPGEGLECCTVCGGFEAGLTADYCPGFRMSSLEGDLVYWTYCNGPNAGRMELPSFEDYNTFADQWNDEMLDAYLTQNGQEETSPPSSDPAHAFVTG